MRTPGGVGASGALTLLVALRCLAALPHLAAAGRPSAVTAAASSEQAELPSELRYKSMHGIADDWALAAREEFPKKAQNLASKAGAAKDASDQYANAVKDSLQGLQAFDGAIDSFRGVVSDTHQKQIHVIKTDLSNTKAVQLKP
mmetsp:Transcript_7648/g.16422  ORF Transcript_7648/g.16422 Transcript_7648/m.16422 type:complete len:144 (+) Transcript_7648:3-434(+)